MAESKKVWYKSKGFWAGLLTTLLGVYAGFQTAFPVWNLPNITPYLPILTGVLGAFGIYARVAADGKIVFSDEPSK